MHHQRELDQQAYRRAARAAIVGPAEQRKTATADQHHEFVARGGAGTERKRRMRGKHHGDDGETAAAGRYVYATPLELNCWPFIVTSTAREPAPLDGGAAHSICLAPTCRAATVAPDPAKRQYNAVVSRKPEPSSATRVPPATGPAAGTTALTIMRGCT